MCTPKNARATFDDHNYVTRHKKRTRSQRMTAKKKNSIFSLQDVQSTHTYTQTRELK